ncbi:MAG TPA: hypothetical protein VI621_14670, partial [Flavobacterium sp.]|nr:hypothetical protein [Flavobacterium sp.]
LTLNQVLTAGNTTPNLINQTGAGQSNTTDYNGTYIQQDDYSGSTILDKYGFSSVKNDGRYVYLKHQDGLGIRTNTTNSLAKLRSDNLTGGTVPTFQFPNKGDGTFILATTADVPALQLTPVYYDANIGSRLTPTDVNMNGFNVTKSFAGALGFTAQNTNAVSNATVSSFTAKGTGTLYEKLISLNYFGASHWIPYLRESGALFSDKKIFVATSNNSDIDFRTGVGLDSATSKFKIVGATGQLAIGVLPTLDNTAVDLLARKADGSLVRVDKSSLTSPVPSLQDVTDIGASTLNTLTTIRGITNTWTNGSMYVGTPYVNDSMRQLTFSTSGNGTTVPSAFNSSLIVNPEDGVYLSSTGPVSQSSVLGLNPGSINLSVSGSALSSEQNNVSINPSFTDFSQKITSSQGSEATFFEFSNSTNFSSKTTLSNTDDGLQMLKLTNSDNFVKIGSDVIEFQDYNTLQNGVSILKNYDQATETQIAVQLPKESGTLALEKPYKVYTALLTQSGTSAPTAIILENTFGVVPTFTYEGVGQYSVTLNGGFITDKTWQMISSNNIGSQDKLEIYDNGDDSVWIDTVTSNGKLNKTPIEIRVYN